MKKSGTLISRKRCPGANGFFLIFAALVLSACGRDKGPIAPATAKVITWARTFGDMNTEEAYSVQESADGGYVAAGYKITGVMGDLLILKLDAEGNQVWAKTFGGAMDDRAYCIETTYDGGYIVTGATRSFGAGNEDIWVMKLDSEGNQVWAKTFGGPGNEWANSVKQTDDGGYIVAGTTDTMGGGGYDMVVIKLDSLGTRIWLKTYGGASVEGGNSVVQAADGGYVVAGVTESKGAGSGDFWILKLDPNGNEVWDRTFGGVNDEVAISIQKTRDGCYVVVGDTHTFGAGESDFWVMKLDSGGDQLWAKTFGGADHDVAISVALTTDGGYIVAGDAESPSAGEDDLRLEKLDGNGNEMWSRTFGGISFDRANSVLQTSDGGYIAAGYTYSFGAGNGDFWILKLDSEGNCDECF